MKKFMRNCAITALCLVALGLALTIVTGSYIGKKTMKETIETVMNMTVDSIKNVGKLENKEDQWDNDSQEGMLATENSEKQDKEEKIQENIKENNRDAKSLLDAENASEAVAALQSLDDETKEEFMATLENSLDAEIMEKVNQAMEGLLTEEELTELLEELNASLDMETKLEVAGQLAGLFGEEEMAAVTNALENAVDEDSLESWADGLGDFFSENFWNSVGEAEFDIEDSITFNNDYEVLQGDVDKTALGSGIIDLNLKVGGASFRVKESEDNQYYVEAEDVSKFQAYVEGECLYIKTLKASANTIDDSTVTLYVPAGCQLASLSVELGAGQITLENIDAARQDLTVGAGQINIKDMQAENMTVEVGMGELVATDIIVDTLNAEVGMGHMLVKGAINKDANIECAMGSVEVECQGAREDFNYEIDGALGEVVIGNKQYAGVTQEQKINNNASKDMRLECAMGSLVIDFKN